MLAGVDRRYLCDFINRQRYGVVSSIAYDGKPQSALVGVACSSELEIVFDTLKSSRKYGNLLARPACSMVVGWSGEQTLQLEGNVEVSRGEKRGQSQEIYCAQWPDGRLRSKLPEMVYLVLCPTWLRFSDFDQSPPFIQEGDAQAFT